MDNDNHDKNTERRTPTSPAKQLHRVNRSLSAKVSASLLIIIGFVMPFILTRDTFVSVNYWDLEISALLSQYTTGDVPSSWSQMEENNTAILLLSEAIARKIGNSGEKQIVSLGRSKSTSIRFAYAYVIGGCDPDSPTYRNVLYNVMVSAYLLRQDNSKADVIIYFQISYNSAHGTLPERDVRLLEAMHIKFRYIPESEHESTTRLMYDRFRILGLKQYERVIILDSDVMLRGSMDYLFDLSVNGVLKKNVVIAGQSTPAMGSFFMICPGEDKWDRILDIIYDKENRGRTLRAPHFDEALGWGHAIEAGDFIQLGNGKVGTSWNFPTAPGDEGLLYHWVKYEENSVSILVNDTIHNWDLGDDGKLRIEEKIQIDSFGSDSKERDCWPEVLRNLPCIPPYSDFVHFPPQAVPWHKQPPDDLKKSHTSSSIAHVWFYTLSLLNEKYKMGLSFQRWHNEIDPLLHMKPTLDEIRGTKYISDFSKTAALHPIKNTTRFAYTYVIGGCDPDNPAYRNYIYDILICTYLQRREGSKADAIVFFQLLHKTKHEALPDEDIRMLKAMNIKFHYIPKTEQESFYRIMLDKFRILELTHYDRVLFLDGDILTMGSMDYLFQLSMEGVLKRNVVFCGMAEPANGGTFMLTPGEGDFDRILDIIRDKEVRGAKLPYPHWDQVKGWGHAFGEKDYYELLTEQKLKVWDFHGAFTDQGLLYHWVKYEEKSVSIIMKNTIQNWDVDDNGNVHLQEEFGLDIFNGYSHQRECIDRLKGKPCKVPHSDFIHFTGKAKPWLKGPPEDYESNPERSGSNYWFYILSLINKELELGLDFESWRKYHRPLLGMYPKYKDAAGAQYRSHE